MKKVLIVILPCIIPLLIIANPIITRARALLDSDLRLAGMGDIGIVIEGFNNQINPYDFGGLGAGIIDDDTLNRYLFLPGFFSFDMTDEAFSNVEDYRGGLAGKGYAKFKDNLIGVSAGINKNEIRADGFKDKQTIINDTLIFGHKFRNFAVAICGGNEIERIVSQRFYGQSHLNIDAIYFAPSVLLKPNHPWALGLGYGYRRVRYHFGVYRGIERYHFHRVNVPVVFSKPDLNIGLKFDYHIAGSELDTVFNKSGLFTMRANRKIRFNNRYITLGLASIYEDSYPYLYGFFDRDKKFKIGFGFSYLNRLGIQYEHEIYYYETDRTVHFNRLSQGFELPFSQQLLFRLGYSLGYLSSGSNPYFFNDRESIISSGLGFYPVDTKLKIDLVLRLKFYKQYDWWYTEPNFGLSFRIF